MNHTLIIAEAGVNHNGDIATAKKLVEVAAAAGADIVKFQTFKAQNMVTTDALMAEYQEKNTQTKTSQFEMLEKLELSYEAHLELIEHCKQLNIVFFSTGFDIESLEMLHDLGQTFFKVPSGEITNYPYLKKMAAFKPTRIIISTGMATMDDIGACIQTFEQAGVTKDKMTVLHCTTDYPAQLKDVNLSAMLSIQKHFGVRVGYSDHTEGLFGSCGCCSHGRRSHREAFYSGSEYARSRSQSFARTRRAKDNGAIYSRSRGLLW